jgi:hypothetical protein
MHIKTPFALKLTFLSRTITLLCLMLLSYNLSAAAFQGNGRIVGKVVDEKGETVIGASVKVQGQTGGASTNIDGAFNLSLPAGTYSLDISYISYQTKRITGVVVKTGESTSLNISLTPATSQLNEVVIVSTYSKSNTEGLFVKQKNAVNFTNGISAEQITKTPDANLGQSLKRITGISTFDNKYVVVRGISERYNVATLDGTPLPSTDYTRRNFSFELIPSDMIESVVVHKTVTADLPVGFAGGLIQVNTKDIPNQDFLTLSIGSGMNDQSTGKSFLSGKRGKYDALGFDDGTRKMVDAPFPLRNNRKDDGSYVQEDYDFGKKFTNNWGLYSYVAKPNRNFALNFGKNYEAKNNVNNRFGFIFGLNYRNSENINFIQTARDAFNMEESFKPAFKDSIGGSGKTYNYNTTLGSMLNIGFRTQKHSLSSKNSFSRVFSNVLSELYGYDNVEETSIMSPSVAPVFKRVNTEPDFLSLLQNKLSGEHQLYGMKFTWEAGRVGINRQRKDMLRSQLFNVNQLFNENYAYYLPSSGTGIYPASRANFNTKQVDYNWNVSASRSFLKETSFANTVKIGYMGSKKDQRSDFVTAYLRKTRNTSLPSFHLFPQYVNLADVHQAANFEQGGLLYEIDPIENNYYGGKLDYAAAYAMVDQKLGKYVRLVAGLRAEKQNLRLINNTTSAGLSMPAGLGPNTEIVKTPFYQEKAIDFLPSANLTVLLSEKINFRLAYSKAMIRPEFAEASRAVNYNNELQGFVQGGLVTSTTTTSYDAKLELFPGFGETISVGAFYKDLQKPLELIRRVEDNNTVFTNLNAQSAKSFGLEFEFRKRLGFINPNAEWLNNFVLSGNASILRSEVVGRRQPKSNEGQFLSEVTATIPNPQPGIKYFTYNYVVEAQNRPLYGQTPLLYNAGIEYNGKIFGASLVHNYSGRKFFFLTNTLLNNEYEAPYQQTDLQLSANLLKEKAKLKINMGNLFNSASYFYNGLYSYKPTEAGITESLLPGFSDDYEVGDQITFRKLTGRTFSISFSYKF